MPKVTIIIEGEMGDLVPVLAKVGELKDIKQPSVKATVVGGEAEWTEERVLEVWEDLSDDCGKVLKEIAKTDNMSWEQLQENLSLTPQEIGGSLSSLGAQLRNHGFKGITYPLVWDDKSEGYNLLPVWRETILKQAQ